VSVQQGLRRIHDAGTVFFPVDQELAGGIVRRRNVGQLRERGPAVQVMLNPVDHARREVKRIAEIQQQGLLVHVADLAARKGLVQRIVHLDVGELERFRVRVQGVNLLPGFRRIRRVGLVGNRQHVSEAADGALDRERRRRQLLAVAALVGAVQHQAFVSVGQLQLELAVLVGVGLVFFGERQRLANVLLGEFERYLVDRIAEQLE
jgi:hypothetical protein